MLTIENLKTELTRAVQTNNEYGSLYGSYYFINIDKIADAARELFIARDLLVDTPDFWYFVNDIMKDVESGLSIQNIVNLIRDMAEGNLISSNFLSETLDTKTHISKIIDDRISPEMAKKLLNYVPTSFSQSSVGKGEYGLILLTANSTKPKNGGDIHVDGVDIEVKGAGAKMASQTSHISLSGITSKAIKFIRNETGKTVSKIPPLTKKNVLGYYSELFADTKLTIEYVKFCFTKVMYQLDPAELSWMDESYVNNGVVDYERLIQRLAILEYKYYKGLAKFDNILFMDKECSHMMNTKSMNNELIKSFKLRQSYSFASERIQTNAFELL